MSTKGKDRLCRSLEIIKGGMKGLVEELLVDRSQGSRGQELGHLTCTEVFEEEFPWYGMNGGFDRFSPNYGTLHNLCTIVDSVAFYLPGFSLFYEPNCVGFKLNLERTILTRQ